MRICDICKTRTPRYETHVTIDEQGRGQKMELCGWCYTKLEQHQNKYAFLAYKETVEEVTGNPPQKKSRWNIFKR